MAPFTCLEGVAAPLDMANVDTDKIVPSRFLKTVTRAGLGEALFADLRQDPDFILNRTPWSDARILVAGDNFGCGSSREHAPWALAAYGIRCLIAPSFAEIFENNCRNNGILTVTLAPSDVSALMAIAGNPAHSVLTVDLPAQRITTGTGQVIGFEIDPGYKKSLIEGLNAIERTLSSADMISAHEADQDIERPWLSAPLRV